MKKVEDAEYIHICCCDPGCPYQGGADESVYIAKNKGDKWGIRCDRPDPQQVFEDQIDRFFALHRECNQDHIKIKWGK
ncbi:MAG: hypothetical protein ACOCQ0_03955 [Desulfosalsimonas sp.]